MTHLVLFIAYLSQRKCCNLSRVNIPTEKLSTRLKGLLGAWSEETGDRGWGQGKKRGSGRWGLREENIGGGGILEFEGERKEWAGSDGSREQKDGKKKAAKLMGREIFMALKKDIVQKAIEGAGAA